jgi:hypothetical protein
MPTFKYNIILPKGREYYFIKENLIIHFNENISFHTMEVYVDNKCISKMNPYNKKPTKIIFLGDIHPDLFNNGLILNNKEWRVVLYTFDDGIKGMSFHF